MNNLLVYYYLIRIEILALILVCGAVVTVYWILRKRWQCKQKMLEQELAECQTMHFQKLHNYFHRIIAHEYSKGLNYYLEQEYRDTGRTGKRTDCSTRQAGRNHCQDS